MGEEEWREVKDIDGGMEEMVRRKARRWKEEE